MNRNAIALVSSLVLLVTPCSADNPVVQTCYTADPAPLLYNNRVYLYVGHDPDNATSYMLREWLCYSSADMVNWTDHGMVLATSSISWSTNREADASQVIYRNGKFYYYISTTASGGVAVGVAVSSSPIGPFRDTLGRPLITAAQMTGCGATHSWRGLDPTVFIDDGGQAYLYWGNNVLYWVRLNADMISTSGSISCLPQNDPAFGPDYEEAPWFYKRNGLYYLIFASQFPEAVDYSTSSGPTGPWTYRSRIMPVDPYGSTTIHPGVIDFGGNSYFFYHNAALPGGGSYTRSVCIEQFTYNGNGTIPAITMTNGGVTTGVGNLNPYDTTQAETICWESGVETQVCSEGGMNVDSIHNRDYIKVEGVNFGTGAASFIARVASARSGGNIELRLDSQTGTLVGTCSVAGTGGWQTWVTRTCTVSGATGIHDLYLRFTGGSGLLFNFNWWKFNPSVGTVPGTAAKDGWRNTIKVVTNGGKTQALRLDFSQQVLQGNVNVCLFDIQGRLAATLFNGRLSSTHLTLPLGRGGIGPGAYLIRVSLNGRIVLNGDNVILFQ
jgi:arabinoxylan arabinofuranohydrolase